MKKVKGFTKVSIHKTDNDFEKLINKMGAKNFRASVSFDEKGKSDIEFMWNERKLKMACDYYGNRTQNYRRLFLVVRNKWTEYETGIITKEDFVSIFDLLPESTTINNPYRAILLREGIEKELVDAQFKQLSKSAHPDVGGNDNAFCDLKSARDEIYMENGW